LLRRELKFERLAIVQSVGTLASVVTVIAGALMGLGVWALVLKQVAGPLFSGVAAWLLMRWQPGRPPRNASLRELLQMGRHVTGFQVANYVERNLDNVLIGRFVGALQLGCYARAYDLLRLPLQQIADPAGTVAMPTLSRLISEPERYRDAYLRMARSVLLFTVPLAPFLVLCAGLADPAGVWPTMAIGDPHVSMAGAVVAGETAELSRSVGCSSLRAHA